MIATRTDSKRITNAGFVNVRMSPGDRSLSSNSRNEPNEAIYRSCACRCRSGDRSRSPRQRPDANRLRQQSCYAQRFHRLSGTLAGRIIDTRRIRSQSHLDKLDDIVPQYGERRGEEHRVRGPVRKQDGADRGQRDVRARHAHSSQVQREQRARQHLVGPRSSGHLRGREQLERLIGRAPTLVLEKPIPTAPCLTACLRVNVHVDSQTPVMQLTKFRIHRRELFSCVQARRAWSSTWSADVRCSQDGMC